MPEAASSIISFNGVSKRYADGREALSGISFDVAPGEFVLFTGHSGAGKSTLLKLIPAIERASSGTVLVNGQNVSTLKARGIPYLRRNLGLVFQDQKLLFDRSVLANVMLPMQLAGQPQRDAVRRARAALDKVGLLERERANPVALSGGEQQRLCIARAVVNRPAILIADEPTAGLDEEYSATIMDMFHSFNQVGVTVLIATHDAAHEIRLAGRSNTRFLALAHGRMTESLGGKSSRNPGHGRGVNAWLRQHGQSLRQTAQRFGAAPLAALANVLVVGVVLALPLGAYVLMANVQAVSASLPTEPQVSVFLAPDISRSDSAALEARLKKADGVRAVRFVPRDAALAGLKNAPGMGDIVSALGDNPLPDAYVTTLAGGDAADRLQADLKAAPGVSYVQVDSAWVRRLEALTRFGRSAALLLAGVLGFALVAVTFNTIRLQILTQSEEIEVSKLIGATDAFVRRPFFYWGVLLGLLSGLAALGLNWLGVWWLNRDLSGFGDFYGVRMHLAFLPAPEAAGFVVFAALLGLLGSYLSVSKHLSQIQPR